MHNYIPSKDGVFFFNSRAILRDGVFFFNEWSAPVN